MTCPSRRAAIDGVESPPPHPAMIGNGQFDEPALVLVEKAGIFRQAGLRLASGQRDRQVANRGGTRPTRAHRRAARCHPLARSANRPRVRAKAVRNDVSLCFSSVSCAPGPSMSPLRMSHINRTRPRQGLQRVIRRGAGFLKSHTSSDAPARVPRHSPRSRVGLVCSSHRASKPRRRDRAGMQGILPEWDLSTGAGNCKTRCRHREPYQGLVLGATTPESLLRTWPKSCSSTYRSRIRITFTQT